MFAWLGFADCLGVGSGNFFAAGIVAKSVLYRALGLLSAALHLCLHCLVACVFSGRGTSSGGFTVFLIVLDMSDDSVEPIL